MTHGRGQAGSRRAAALALVALVWTSAIAGPAAAQEFPVDGQPTTTTTLPTDPDAALEVWEANTERQSELLEELDALAATQEELLDAVERLEANLELQQRQLDEAQRELADRIVATQQARQRYDAKQAELAELQALLDEMVVDAFINPPSVNELSALIGAEDPNEAEAKEVLRGTKIDYDVDLIAEVERVKAELGRLAEQAAEAERLASEARDAQVAAVADLDDALRDHAVFVFEVDKRIEADFLEAVTIADQNAQLAETLAAEARALAARLTGRPDRGGIEIVQVDGFRVHETLAPQLERLLDHAARDGIVLGGGGYRSTEDQIALRRAHCGEEGVFTAPPSACSPPTARPGHSLHEIGLALDFTVNGRIIASRSDPAFLWLAEHAATYGLFNLPSEPWHWSVNGN